MKAIPITKAQATVILGCKSISIFRKEREAELGTNLLLCDGQIVGACTVDAVWKDFNGWEWRISDIRECEPYPIGRTSRTRCLTVSNDVYSKLEFVEAAK